MLLSNCSHGGFCPWYLVPLRDVNVIPFRTLAVCLNFLLFLLLIIQLKIKPTKTFNQNRKVEGTWDLETQRTEFGSWLCYLFFL